VEDYRKEEEMGKRTLYAIMVSLLGLTVAACAAAPGFEQAPPIAATMVVEREAVLEAPAAEPGESGAKAADYAATERLIIRNANLDIVVEDTQEAVDQIDALAEELGGFVLESNLTEYEEGMRAYLRLRVPVESLDTALQRIRDLAEEVRSESISGQDVTEEYVDLRSRMRHLEATEERLLTFMEEAEDTEAALEVYDRLQRIQADIEQVRGRMQYLEESAALATIILNITPSELAQPIQVGGWRPRGTLRNAFESLIRVLQFLVDAAIVIVVLVAPILAVIALPLVGLFFLIRALVRRRRRRKKETEA
jgi:exonuclease VII small subunit